MAGDSIRVSTDQVNQIALDLENLNKQLRSELESSKQTIDNLSNIWTGEAAQETIASFDSFSSKFFQKYEDVIQRYVEFLRKNVDLGYTETENSNVKLSEAFK